GHFRRQRPDKRLLEVGVSNFWGEQRCQLPNMTGAESIGLKDLALKSEVGLAHVMQHGQHAETVQLLFGQDGVRTGVQDPSEPVQFAQCAEHEGHVETDRKSTRLNSSHVKSSYAVSC